MDDKKLIQKIKELEKEIIALKANKKNRKGFFTKTFSKINVIIGIFLSVLITSAVLYAAKITFTDGNSISASQVNNNFDELYTGMNTNANSITNLTTNVNDINNVVNTNADANWRIIGNSGQPAFLNGWDHAYSDEQLKCAFRKDAAGNVHIMGFFDYNGSGNSNDAIFYLPSGYRPPRAFLQFCVNGINTIGQLVQTDLSVSPNGRVSMGSGLSKANINIIFNANN